MSTYPEDLWYHTEDTWARLEPDGRVRVGITDFAQDQLGEIEWVEFPDVGDDVRRGEPFGVIESAKAASDLHSPVDGTVVESHEDLVRSLSSVNDDPYGSGWLVLVLPTSPPGDGLMDAAAYQAKVGDTE